MSSDNNNDIVEAVHALTAFLRNGSQTPDPQKFTPEQLRIQRDFEDLSGGLGRRRVPVLPGSVLQAGQLDLGAPLPAGAYRIAGYTGRRAEVWKVKVADATTTPTRLRHKNIVTPGVARIWVFDKRDRLMAVGTPRILEPSYPTS